MKLAVIQDETKLDGVQYFSKLFVSIYFLNDQIPFMLHSKYQLFYNNTTTVMTAKLRVSPTGVSNVHYADAATKF